MKGTNWIDSIVTARPPAVQPWHVRMMDRLLEWMERSRQRAALGRLEDRLLRDIGCDRARAAAEADKPFWRE